MGGEIIGASYGLVKFKKTGNVYYCCYEGTSDIMIPFLCTPEECFDKSFDRFCAISYCRELGDKAKTWEFPEVDDLDDIDYNSVIVYESSEELMHETHSCPCGRVIFDWRNYKK